MQSGLNNNYLYSAVRVKSVFTRSGMEEVKYGTAFFVRNRKNQVCLITNRHLVEYGYKKTGPDYAGFVLIGMFVDVYDPQTQSIRRNVEIEIGKLIFPKEHNNDVAAITNVQAKGLNPENNKLGFAVSYEHIAKDNFFKNNLTVCEFVAFSGYPEGYDKENCRPIFRVGTIASDPRENYAYDDIARGECVLFEAFSFGGSSGSPVFRFTKLAHLSNQEDILSNFNPMFIGINAGFLPIDDNSMIDKKYRHSGLSYFYKSTVVLELIDL